MPRLKFLFFFLSCLLLIISACDRGQGVSAIPRTALEDSDMGPLPFSVSWVRIFYNESDEDIWRPMEYAPPTVADGVVFIGNNLKRFYALDASNGDVIWSFTTNGPVESGAVVLGDKVFFGDGDGYVYCLNRKDGFAKWTYRVQGQVMGRLATDGNLIFVATNHERLYAINAEDGRWKWMQGRDLPTTFTIRGVCSPVVDGDRVLMGYADGYFLAYRAADGSELFKTLLQKGERFTDVDASPIIDGAYIYIASYGGTFYCLSRDNASIQWTFRKGSVQNAAISGEKVLLSDDEGLVHALDKKTGRELWGFDVRENDLLHSLARGPRRKLKIPTSPIAYAGYVIVASSSGYVYALDEKDGTCKWSFWPGYGVTSAITLDHNHNLFIHTNYGNVYCLRPKYFYKFN